MRKKIAVSNCSKMTVFRTFSIDFKKKLNGKVKRKSAQQSEDVLRLK